MVEAWGAETGQYLYWSRPMASDFESVDMPDTVWEPVTVRTSMGDRLAIESPVPIKRIDFGAINQEDGDE